MRLYSEAERLNEMTRDRRALHQIPEFGYDLYKTRAYVMEKLIATKPDALEPCDEGIRAVFRAHAPEQDAIAFRADMDALMIAEKTRHDFPSRHPGCMHACGHDGHMACLLMLARVISGQRSRLKRDVVLLFQPAEENQGGARRMQEAGAFEDPKVSEVYGMHLMPQVPLGKIGLRSGPLMALVESVDITVQGVSSHGAEPHRGADAIAAAAHIVTSIQAALSRRINPMETRLFTVGKIEGGEIRNIIADRVEMQATLRAYSDEIAEEMHTLIRASLSGADQLYGTHSALKLGTKYPALINHDGCVQKVRGIVGERAVEVEPLAIGEDFSEYLRAVPGAFLFCGMGDQEHHMPLHSADFDFDERALLTGLMVFEALAFA